MADVALHSCGRSPERDCVTVLDVISVMLHDRSLVRVGQVEERCGIGARTLQRLFERDVGATRNGCKRATGSTTPWATSMRDTTDRWPTERLDTAGSTKPTSPTSSPNSSAYLPAPISIHDDEKIRGAAPSCVWVADRSGIR